MRERVATESLDRGIVGTKKTLDKMHKLVALGKLDPTIQKIATWIRLTVPGEDRRRGSSRAVADAVFWFIRRHGIFQRDPFQIEKIEHPIAAMYPVIQARRAGTYRGSGLFVGDCDTLAAVWLDSILGALGFNYAFETAKVDLDRPDEFSHVWSSVRLDGDWYSLDPSTSTAYPGWRPPVAPELFARWPEPAIESVLSEREARGAGAGSMRMVRWNGNGNGRFRGMGQNGDDRAYVPSDYFGYGIPKNVGDGPTVIPEADPADLGLNVPRDTQLSRADVDESDSSPIKKVPLENPSRRSGPSGEQPDDHGPPYYRRLGRQPYYKIEREPAPPGSLWNKERALDTPSFHHHGGRYISVQEPGSPERRVEVHMAQPMTLRRRPEFVTLRPESIPGGGSMGYLRPAGMADGEIITSLDDTPAASSTSQTKAAASAGQDTFSTIMKTISSLGVSTSSALAAKYGQAVMNATNKVAGKKVVKPGTGGGSIFSSPWFWGGAVVVVGGVTYVVTR